MGERGEVDILQHDTAEEMTAAINWHLNCGYVFSQEVRLIQEGNMIGYWCVMAKYPEKEGK